MVCILSTYKIFNRDTPDCTAGTGSKELTRDPTRPGLNDYALGDIYEHFEDLYFSLYSRHDMQTSSAYHHNLTQGI